MNSSASALYTIFLASVSLLLDGLSGVASMKDDRLSPAFELAYGLKSVSSSCAAERIECTSPAIGDFLPTVGVLYLVRGTNGDALLPFESNERRGDAAGDVG